MTSTVDTSVDGVEAASSAAQVGRTERGAVTIDDRVVAKIAARAAIEIADAGGAAPRILGRSLDGLKGARSTSLDSLPSATADVDGALVVLSLQISVRWPASVPEVCSEVRKHVADRVTMITGLTVSEIAIAVTDLVTHLSPPPRVS